MVGRCGCCGHCGPAKMAKLAMPSQDIKRYIENSMLIENVFSGRLIGLLVLKHYSGKVKLTKRGAFALKTIRIFLVNLKI